MGLWFVNSIAKSSPVVVREPFVRLVKLVASAFYDNYTPESDKQQKSAKSDNKGIAVIVLNALTRWQWVKEEDLLPGGPKQLLRKVLRYFEEQKFIMRVDRKESARGAKKNSVSVANGQPGAKVKVHIHSYYCLDYSQIYDVVRYKLHRMKKELKDELEDKDTIQEYGCLNCKRKYNALDALRLISMADDSFHCEKCNGELVMEETVDGDDNARRRQREDLLQKMEVQLKPLMDHINRIKDIPVPSFESFPAWEARAAKAARENGYLNPDDPSRSQGGYGSTLMPFLRETEVEVNLGEKREDVNSEGGGDPSVKLFPSWLIKEGMNLTEEQRGYQMRQETKVDDGGSGGASEISDDKKPAMGSGDDKYLMDEYIKACYAAILEQKEIAEKLNKQESSGKLSPDIQLATSTSLDRQVGMKCKREDQEDVEWEEEAPVAANGNYKEEEDEEDVDWEEG
ncbi:PREDICTED: transcription initiation factor IIE subunit alpha-like [Camelina sativa]|uniref:Transcription initiation factor IIE subunit alpha-like n=1 Tax=Camelina sativa TaxID=90675 RepID=A0ABM0V5Z8_CAMSA|nr:PREDICTED: transcription initiation factor IIE subunit alpha-like [Camelina sativa]